MPKFNDLKEGEQLIFVIRKHWWFFIKFFFQALALLIITIILLILKISYSWILVIVAMIAGIGLFFYYWFLWKNDMYILTDQRLIDIDRNNIFHKQVTEVSLDKIQDVSYTVSGMIPMILNFGKVSIQTAGQSENVEIRLAPRPQNLQKQISQTFHNYREKIGHAKSVDMKGVHL